MRTAIALGSLVLAAAVLTGCGGCGSDPSGAVVSASAGTSAAPSASVAAKPPREPKPPWIGVDGPVAPLQAALDPKTAGPYNGPTATLRGKITIKGDPPPATTLTFPKECPLADNMYGKLFRVGEGGGVADVLVAVTGYDAFVPAQTEAVEVTINGCAFDRRTVAVALGQRIDVRNVDRTVAFTPFLDGSEYSAMRVAVPGGVSVPLSTRKPGQFLLRDAMKRPFMLADVFVVKYATTAITKVDGGYEVSGLPAGKVRVDALLPIIRKTTGKDIELKEGDNTLDIELVYDAKVDRPVPVPDPQFGTRRDPNAPKAPGPPPPPAPAP